MTAEEIVAMAEAVYARCRTYADSGCVRSVFRYTDGKGDFVTTKPFETAFIRPDRFRFEFSSHHPNRAEFHRYIIVADGPVVRTWWDIRPGVERRESLALALAGATGVSGASAHTVPALLMPDRVSGGRLAEGSTLTRLDDGELEGTMCYRVERRVTVDPEEERQRREEATRILGQAPPDAETGPDVLWLERTTFLIRRIESRFRFPTFGTEHDTSYDPVMDEHIPDDHLTFDPPESVA